MVEKYNDNYQAYKYIVKAGNKILAITQRENSNKGSGLEEPFSTDMNGDFEIHRIFKNLGELRSIKERQKKIGKIRELIKEFQPDVIFCEELTNIQLAIKIKKEIKIPIVLRVEFAYNEAEPYRTMGNKLKYFKNFLTGDHIPKIIGKIIWDNACKNSSAVISCYYQDSLREISIYKSLPTYYVPWPTHVPVELTDCERKRDRAVFIGSFDKHKNLQEFLETIPKLFEFTPINEFIVVGDGEDYEVIEKLRVKFPEKLIHIKSLNRNDCLKLIRSSYFSYSPAIRGGWGFIGDSWATKTPIVVTHNHYGFNDSIDSVVANSENIHKKINDLYDNNFYSTVSSGGFNKFEEQHTAESVAKRYIQICENSLNKQ